ncbi:MAG: hypothetical protein NZN45_03260 [Rhodovarius sp.]|nr:hypothetical protein [Rhodovarius sp.]
MRKGDAMRWGWILCLGALLLMPGHAEASREQKPQRPEARAETSAALQAGRPSQPARAATGGQAAQARPVTAAAQPARTVPSSPRPVPTSPSPVRLVSAPSGPAAAIPALHGQAARQPTRAEQQAALRRAGYEAQRARAIAAQTQRQAEPYRALRPAQPVQVAGHCTMANGRRVCTGQRQAALRWAAGLAPAAGSQAQCPDGTVAILALGHEDIYRCVPF